MTQREVSPHIEELIESGAMAPVVVEGWQETAYLSSDASAAATDLAVSRMLSPFDPVVWFRPRALRLFQFPLPHRDLRAGRQAPMGLLRSCHFGMGENIVARVDLKADRHNSARYWFWLSMRNPGLNSGDWAWTAWWQSCRDYKRLAGPGIDPGFEPHNPISRSDWRQRN